MRLVATLFSLFLAAPALASSLEVGKPVPEFDIKLADGRHVTPASTAGRVTIINFWATWCSPCRKEMPELEAFYRKYRERGVDVIAVSLDKADEQVEARKVMQGFSFPLAFVDDAEVRGFGRLWRVPVTFVIDRQGVLRRDGWHAEPTVDLPLLEQQVVPLLQP